MLVYNGPAKVDIRSNTLVQLNPFRATERKFVAVERQTDNRRFIAGLELVSCGHAKQTGQQVCLVISSFLSFTPDEYAS